MYFTAFTETLISLILTTEDKNYGKDKLATAIQKFWTYCSSKEWNHAISAQSRESKYCPGIVECKDQGNNQILAQRLMVPVVSILMIANQTLARMTKQGR